ncbi:MAG: cysteine desulfurase family protein [Butyribacter sp.]|nr:cysteine desulfurase family protein [bacterium]MDY3855322.1 cysteine desulfurase family protein [Butyribacter sp.]
MIYLDHAATTAVHPEVFQEMYPFFMQMYANPSAAYEFGRDAKIMLQCVRETIAESIHARPEEIYFTSGGTEADNWALIGIAEVMKAKGKHIITSSIEHHAILRTCHYLEKRGFLVTYLPVNENGEISLEDLEKAIRPDTILISIMFANNEIGTVMPVKQIGKLAKKHHIIFHTDAVQAYLHEKIDVKEMQIDLLSASGHKFQGPKGVGFLYVRDGIRLSSFLHGGSQERKKRAGTENVPGIVGLGKAAAIGIRDFEKNHLHLLAMQKYLTEQITKQIPDCKVNGLAAKHLDNNLSLSFPFLEAASLIALLDMEQIYISAGSACNSSETKISHVLQAIGMPKEMARGTIRISLGAENTMEEMKYFVKRLVFLAEQLRMFSEENSIAPKTSVRQRDL